MSELPLAGATRGVHETVIEVSEYAVIVGAAIVSGILLILAPAVFTDDTVLVPNAFVADNLTCTSSSKTRLNGAAVSVAIGTTHFNAEITVADVPSHEDEVVHVVPSCCSISIVYDVMVS
jgi:hypothetical protein